MKVVTIGVYGFTEETFFQALLDAGVDTLCDIRQRRGVRGAAYAFANSQRLQKRLAELDIDYLYRRDLAPTNAVRERQKEVDKVGKVAKRKRDVLSQAFTVAYEAEILDRIDPRSLLEELDTENQVVALLCVEKEPAACHRSLVADKMQQEFGFGVEHIRP